MNLDPITKLILEDKQDAINIKMIKENSPDMKDVFILWKSFIDDDNNYRVKYGLKTIGNSDKDFKETLRYRTMFCAYKDNIPTGIIGVFLGKDFGQLSSLIVDPKFRGKGIAAALIESAINYCKKEGRKQVYLNVWDANKSAEKLYLKLGFKSIDHDMIKFI